ncbi:MAG: hypothetical protein JNK12_07875 [Acidimicrobiales bacterium]|nr:hypothetical protein [Acidimicrobiales bacterium]
MADLSYPVALGATLAVEVPLYAALLPRLAPVSRSRAVAVGVAVNVVSHPLLWFVLVPLVEQAGASTVVAVAVAELLVWLLEAALCRLLAGSGWRASLEVAAVANAASLGLGLVLAGL